MLAPSVWQDCCVVLAPWTATSASFFSFLFEITHSSYFLASHGHRNNPSVLCSVPVPTALCSLVKVTRSEDLGCSKWLRTNGKLQQLKGKQNGFQTLTQSIKEAKVPWKPARKPRTGNCDVGWEQDRPWHRLLTHLEWKFILTGNDPIVVLHYLHTLDFWNINESLSVFFLRSTLIVG